MNQIQSVLFIIFWIVAMLSWFFSIVEILSIHLFNELFFHIGIPIIKRFEHIPKQTYLIRLDTIYKSKKGKFRFITNSKCLFISRFSLLVRPCLIRGSVNWDVPHTETCAKVIGRVPLGLIIFFMSLSIGWTIGAINHGNLLVTILPWITLMPAFGIILFTAEKHRFDIMVNELRQIASEKHISKNHISKTVD